MLLAQRDPRWANIQLGASPYSLGPSGCFVTVIADILETTPDVINQRLNAINGFAADADKYLDLVDWSKIEIAFPGVNAIYKKPYDNADVLAQLAAGNSVLVEVPAAPIGGTGIHAVRYIGNHQLNDPWSATVRPTSDFPGALSYVVFFGTWQIPAATPPAAPTAAAPAPSALATSFGNAINKSKNFDTVANFLGISQDQAVQLTAGQQVIDYIKKIQQDNEDLSQQVETVVKTAKAAASVTTLAATVAAPAAPTPPVTLPVVPPKPNLATAKIAQKVVPPSAVFKNGQSPVANTSTPPTFTVETKQGGVSVKEFFSALLRTLFS